MEKKTNVSLSDPPKYTGPAKVNPPLFNKNVLEKASLVILGLIISLLILELILQGLSFFLFHTQRSNFILNDDRDAYRILTLGESTTAQNLETSYSSWPQELEKILNSGKLNTSFIVFNEGLSSTNTGFIASNFNAYLEKYNPNMVIAMMGTNDPAESPFFFNENDKKTFFKLPKFFHLIRLSLIKKSNDANFEKIIRKTDQKCETHFDNLTPEIEASIMTLSDNLTPDEFGKRLNEFQPGNNCYINLGYAKLYELMARNTHNYSDKVILLEREIIYLQNASSDNKIYYYYTLGKALINLGDLTDNRTLINRAKLNFEIAYYLKKKNNIDFSDDIPAEILMAFALSNSSIEETKEYYEIWGINGFQYTKTSDFTKLNYIYIVKQAQKRNIKFVAMQYPLTDINELKITLANFSDVMFVNNSDNFAAALKNNSYDELFWDKVRPTFGHATLLGNRLIAINLANNIVDYLNLTDFDLK